VSCDHNFSRSAGLSSTDSICIPVMSVIFSEGSRGSEERDHDGATVESSPRTSLLSSPDNAHSESRRHRHRGPSERYRKVRELAHSGVDKRDLVRLLVDEKQQSRRMRKVLYSALERLEIETRRTAEAEHLIIETSQKCRSVNDAKLLAEQDAASARHELGLYRLQLDNAQREILRAQESLVLLEAQRDESEAAAARARSTARQLNDEHLVQVAREEGRRLGFMEGLRGGRHIRYKDGRAQESGHGETQIEDHSYRGDSGSERSHTSGGRPIPAPAATSSSGAVDPPDDDRSGQVMSAANPEGKFREIFSDDPVVFDNPVSQNLPAPDPVLPSITEPPGQVLGRTPPIQVYSLPIPTHEELFGPSSAQSNLPPPNNSTSSGPVGDFAGPEPSRRSLGRTPPIEVYSLPIPTHEELYGRPFQSSVPPLAKGRPLDSELWPASRGAEGLSGSRQDSIITPVDRLKARNMGDADGFEFGHHSSDPDGVEKPKSVSRRNRPPRQRPMIASTPARSSSGSSDTHNSGYQRRHFVGSHPEPSQGKPTVAADPRRTVSPESPTPAIIIEPPSRSPSDTPVSRQPVYPAPDLLSPEHANVPLPTTNDLLHVSSAANSPALPPLPPVESSTPLPDYHPTGFVPNSTSSFPQLNEIGSTNQTALSDFSQSQPRAFRSRPVSPGKNSARAGLTTFSSEGYLTSHSQDKPMINETSQSGMPLHVPLPPSMTGSPHLTTPSRTSQVARSSSSLSYVTDPFPD